jgi:hypothetical protein
MISEFWPARQFHGSNLPRRNSRMPFRRSTEFTILYPAKFLAISQSTNSSTFGQSSRVTYVLFSLRLEMGLLDHWRFIDVVVGCDTVLVGDLRQLPNIIHAADVSAGAQ